MKEEGGGGVEKIEKKFNIISLTQYNVNIIQERTR